MCQGCHNINYFFFIYQIGQIFSRLKIQDFFNSQEKGFAFFFFKRKNKKGFCSNINHCVCF